MMRLCSPAAGGHRSFACQDAVERYYRKWYPTSRESLLPESGYSIICWRVKAWGWLPTVYHCEIADSGDCKIRWRDGEACDEYPIYWASNDCSRRIEEYGKKCCDATLDDVRECLKKRAGWRVTSGAWYLYGPDDNCQTWSGASVYHCCGKTTWSPSWYAPMDFVLPPGTQWRQRCVESEPEIQQQGVTISRCVRWEKSPWIF